MQYVWVTLYTKQSYGFRTYPTLCQRSVFRIHPPWRSTSAPTYTMVVLQAITIVGDATAVRPGILLKKSPSGHQTPNHLNKMSGELSISHILGTSDILGNSSDILLDLGYVYDGFSIEWMIFTRLRSRGVVMYLVVVYVRSFIRSFPHTTACILHILTKLEI